MAYTASVGGMFLLGAARVPAGRPCMKLHDGERWLELQWSEAERAVRETALGLLELGLQPQEPLAIFADGSPAAAITGLAAMAVRGLAVALHAETPTQRLAECLHAARARAVVLQGEEQATAVRANLEAFRAVDHFLVADPSFVCDDPRFVSLESLRDQGRRGRQDETLLARFDQAQVDDLALAVFSDGAAAPLRCHRLTNGNLLAATESVVKALPLTAEDAILCEPSLADPAAWSAALLPGLHAQVPVIWPSGRDPGEVMTATKPTVIVGGAWFSLELRAQTLRAADGDGTRAKLDAALAVDRRVRGDDEERAPLTARLRARGARRRLDRVRERLGDSLHRLVVWPPTMPADAVDFFRGLDVDVHEAWAPFEASGVIALSGRVGARDGWLDAPLGESEVALGRANELTVKGPSVIFDPRRLETYLQPRPTRRLGQVGDDGRVRVRGPVHRCVEGPDGPFDPVRLEQALERDPLVRRAAAAGDGDGQLTVLFCLSLPQHREWAASKRLPPLEPEEALARWAEQIYLRRLVRDLCAAVPGAPRATAIYATAARWKTTRGDLLPSGEPNRAGLLGNLDRFVPVKLT